MPLPPRRALTLSAATLLTLTLLSPAASATHASQARAAGPLLWEAIEELPLGTESRDGYNRRSFKHWVDADGDGCDARREVLIEEALDPPEVGPGCDLSGGRWYSYYDDVTVYSAGDLHIDHVVALAEAFDSGAYAWDAAKRERYANYLDRPEHLIAVTGSSNIRKSDKDPAEWLPIPAVRCRYIAEWTAIKRHWGLTVDEREKNALAEAAHACPNAPLPGDDTQA